MLNGGFLHLLDWRKVPVELHWSVLALAALAVIADRASPYQIFASALLILAHELGHAVLVERYHLRVHRIVIHPFGGECVHEGTASMRARVAIAWGGVLGQAVVFVVALALSQIDALVRITAVREMLVVATGYNLFMAAFNLIPIAPLDGYTAWRLRHLWPRGRGSMGKAARRATLKPLSRSERRHVELVVDRALEQARATTEKEDEPSER